MHAQNYCLIMKKGIYEQQGKQYTASPEEALSRDQILTLFDNIKIEEYFKGTNYVRIESGKKIDFEKFIEDSKNTTDLDKFNCKFPVISYSILDIKRLDKNITIQTTNDGGTVEVVDIPKASQKYLTKETPFEFVKIIDVNNSKYKCGLNDDLQFCYLKDMQVHHGSGQRVLVQVVAPMPGSKQDEKLDAERDALYDPFKGTARAAGLPKIEENLSIIVGEEISDDKFEIPNFAKNFKTTKQ